MTIFFTEADLHAHHRKAELRRDLDLRLEIGDLLLVRHWPAAVPKRIGIGTQAGRHAPVFVHEPAKFADESAIDTWIATNGLKPYDFDPRPDLTIRQPREQGLERVLTQSPFVGKGEQRYPKIEFSVAHG